MPQPSAANQLIQKVTDWASKCEDIEGLLLVGSYARGNPRPDSDVDLLILTDNKSFYLNNLNWTEGFEKTLKITTEQWGAVTSIRVNFNSGIEIEFGFALPPWASVDPLDPGTRRVVEGAAKVLWDPNQILARLIHQI